MRREVVGKAIVKVRDLRGPLPGELARYPLRGGTVRGNGHNGKAAADLNDLHNRIQFTLSISCGKMQRLHATCELQRFKPLVSIPVTPALRLRSGHLKFIATGFTRKSVFPRTVR